MYEKAIKINPRIADYFNNKGMLKYFIKDLNFVKFKNFNKLL